MNEHRAAELGHESCGTFEPSVLGHDETGIVAPVVGMGYDDAGVRVRRSQPLHGYAPFDGKERQDRASAPNGGGWQIL